MHNRLKKGLALMILSSVYLGNVFAGDYSPKGYGPLNKPFDPNEMYSVNQRNDSGFGALELGIAGLASVYFLRRFLKEKQQ